VTVMTELPVFPAVVARTVVVPGATAVTRPELVTVATAGLVEDQVNTVPVVAGLVEAESCTVCPTCREADDGDTDTDLIAGPPLASAPSGDVGASAPGVPHETSRTAMALFHAHFMRPRDARG